MKSYQYEDGSALLADEKPKSTAPWFTIFVAVLAFAVGIGGGIGFGHLIWETRPEVKQPGLCMPPLNAPEIPKNLILVIGDGNGPTSVSLARLMKQSSLVVDDLIIGTVLTRSTDSIITDSAASATAYACGKKTNNGWVAVDPVTSTPIGTIFEAARDLGYSIGVVTSAEVTDATPAAFTSHSITRKTEDFIAAQQINQGADIILGGGSDYYSPETIQSALDKGYTIVKTKEELLNASELPILGLFAPEFLSFELDRELTNEPSLVEMTQHALTLLEAQNNPNGFLLLVEEGAIDLTQHLWDAGSAYRAGMSLDDTNGLIMDFAKRRNDTLVLITADHECGGIALGLNGVKNFAPEYLLIQQRSTLFMSDTIGPNGDSELVLSTIQNYTGIIPNATEIDTVLNVPDHYVRARAISKIISDRAYTGWTTREHTAADVGLYGYGPGVQHFCGTRDNTEIGNKIISLLSLDVDAVTERIKNNPVSP